MPPERWLSTALLGGILVTTGLPPATACGYHGTIGNYLSVMHPDSLAVAVALRRASNDGVIDADEASFSAKRPALYIDAVRRLHKLKAALTQSASPDDSPSNIALGFVESGLWTRYRVAAGQVQMQIHVSGPEDGDAVVLTAEPVLARLLSGTLSSEDALSRELIVIDAPGTDLQPVRTELTRALDQAANSPRAGGRRQTSNSRPSTEDATKNHKKAPPAGS